MQCLCCCIPTFVINTHCYLKFCHLRQLSSLSVAKHRCVQCLSVSLSALQAVTLLSSASLCGSHSVQPLPNHFGLLFLLVAKGSLILPPAVSAEALVPQLEVTRVHCTVYQRYRVLNSGLREVTQRTSLWRRSPFAESYTHTASYQWLSSRWPRYDTDMADATDRILACPAPPVFVMRTVRRAISCSSTCMMYASRWGRQWQLR